MGTLEYPTLALVFTLVLVGYSVWDVDRLSGKRHGGRAAGLSLAGAALPGVPVLAGAESGQSGPVLSAGAVNAATGDPRAAGSPARPGEPAAGQSGAGRASAGRETTAARAVLLSPGTATGCRIAMGVTMAFMLVIMI